jgi:hypothetical protein
MSPSETLNRAHVTLTAYDAKDPDALAVHFIGRIA